jgi:WD40 repeat protein
LEEEGLANRLTQKHSDLAITTLEQWDTSPQFNLDTGKANYLVLPRALFPNGTAYYNVKLPQRFGVVPFIVHNNCIIGHDSKVDRFKMYGQWFTAESEDYDPTKDEKFHPTSITPLVSLTPHREIVTCLSIHPDNKTIYTAAYDKTVKVYKTEHILQALNHASQTPPPTLTILRPSGGCLLNRRGGVWCMAWIPGHLGPDNPESASSSSSPTQAEDAATTIHVAAPTHPMLATIMGLVHSSTEANKEHKSSATSEALPLCATGGHDRHVMVFQTAHGLENDIFANTGPWKQIHTMKGHQGVVNDLIFHRDSLFSCSDDGTVRSWDVKSGEKTRIYRGGSGWFSSLMVDGPALFAASSDGSCYAWDIASARLVQVYDPRHSRSGWIRSIAVDGARKRVYTAGSDGSITEWDMIQGEIIRTIHNAHSKGINTIKLIRSQNGNKDYNLILSASDDGLIRAWKLSTLRNVGQFDGHYGSVLTLLVTDSFFLSGGADHTPKVWALPKLD